MRTYWAGLPPGGGLGGSNVDPAIQDIVGEVKPPSGLEEFSQSPVDSLSNLMTIAIKLFFIVAGLVALLYLLRGAVDWIMSSGDKEKVGAAQQRIQNAIIGLILLIIVLGLIATLESLVFKERFCFGLTCPIQLPKFD